MDGALAGWFDVEPFRRAGRRVVVRQVSRPVLVLGSTQPAGTVDRAHAACRGIAVTRRRSGGGAVLLVPDGQVWVDLWVPRADALWSREPRRAAEAAGEWWARALTAAGVAAGLSVHRGGSAGAPGSELACFAGIGPGEVTLGAKLVGLAQWRCREGTLVHGCAYRRWDPGGLVDLLAMSDERRAALRVLLDGAAVGLDDAGVPAFDGGHLVAALPGGAPWEVESVSG